MVLLSVFLVLAVIAQQILCRIGQRLAPAAFLLILIVAAGLWMDPAGTTDKLLWCGQSMEKRCQVIMTKVKNQPSTEKKTATTAMPPSL